MKIKVLLLSVLLLGTVTACVNDLPDAGCSKVKQLSVVLSLDDVQTKTVGDEIDPNAKEATIKNYYVALFNAGGKRLDYVTGNSPVAINSTDKPAKYKVDFKDVPDGAVSVYVIVNYKNAANWNFDDGNWGDLNAYSSKKITSVMNTVDELVKVGCEKFTVSSTSTTLDVPLTQLAAGIDIRITSVIKPNEKWDPIDLTYSFPEDSTQVKVMTEIETYIGKERLQNTINMYMPYQGETSFKWVDELVKEDGSWADGTKQWNDLASVHIGNNEGVIDYTKPEEGALYFRATRNGVGFISDFKIIAFKRPVKCTFKLPLIGAVAGSTNVKVNKTSFIMPDAVNTVSDLESFAFGTRFYTYPVSTGMDLVMDVNVGQGICGYNLYDKDIIQYGYRIYKGSWVTGEKKAYQWVKFVDVWLDPKDTGILEEGRTPSGTDDTLPEVNPLTNIKAYTMTIKDANLEKGHLYQVTGKYNPYVDAMISWEIVPMDKIEVDVPSFE